ncbi:MAG: HAMP domain-containing protein [Nitrospirae bacterium]|nr:HAMP domain-containing protein [Nitrospirota bacterium]
MIYQTEQHLSSTLDTIAGLLKLEDDHGQLQTELIELSNSAQGVYAEELSGHYYQVVNSNGIILARSPSLGLAEEILPVRFNVGTSLSETSIGPGNIQIRLVSADYKFSQGILTLQTADSLEGTYTLLGSFRKIVIITYPVIFLLCGAGTFLITAWALRSIKLFADRIDDISERDLSKRVDEEESAYELKGLAYSFNKMLDRLEISFNKQRQFLSDASHELRTPTSILRSYCDITLKRDRTVDDYKDVLNKMSHAVNRMCDIINRILTISRFDSNAISFKPVKVNLKELIEGILKMVEPTAASRGIKINNAVNDVFVTGDREGLAEVFSNIVENAIKYNRPEGTVDIHIKEVNGDAVIDVEDTGIGIPEEDKEKVFDRFYRVDASRGETIGSGLGLSIVRAIVKSHGGRIEVESKLGKGSLFRVYLPKNYNLNN